MKKFKAGDILIQYAKGRVYSELLKVIRTFNGKYIIEFTDGSSGEYSHNYIENGSPEWYPARYLNDEEKIIWL